MIQKHWFAVGAAALVLAGSWIAAEANAYARAGACSAPAARRESLHAWRQVEAAAKTLESARLGGSRYAAAKAGGEADEALVRNAELRLAAATERLHAARAACQVAE